MAGFVKKCPCLRPPTEEIYVLDYRHSNLSDLPNEVFNLERTLQELYADNNQIRELTRELFYCHGLQKLCLSDNEITTIPPAIGSLINLDVLDISKNGIIDLPDNIKACKHLRSLEASVNPLGKLPDGITQLLNLRELYLNDTFLDFLPGNFGRLTKLKVLELRENHLKTLPKSFSRLVELERLDIGNNSLTELSDVIGGLVSLLELWCDQNKIFTISSLIGNLKQLMFFDASKNQLDTLPNEIEGCTSLADLYLTSNNIKFLPDSIGQLINLTTMKIDDNMLTSLPASVGNLSSLSEINVSINDLEDIPSTIGLLRNLRTMYADENFLKKIPPEIGSCNGITVLSLRSNKLRYIPDEIGRIPHLRVLNLSDNQLKHLPFSIVKLKELQALWLTENQTRPLVQLQSDKDPKTGRKILTCYLFPQRSEKNQDSSNDAASFHASLWEEERLRRQQIHFAVGDDKDEDGKLSRCPTPYPKEMKEKKRHVQNMMTHQQMAANGHENRGFEQEDKKLNRNNHLRSDQKSLKPLDEKKAGSVSELRSGSVENVSADSSRPSRCHSHYHSDSNYNQNDAGVKATHSYSSIHIASDQSLEQIYSHRSKELGSPARSHYKDPSLKDQNSPSAIVPCQSSPSRVKGSHNPLYPHQRYLAYSPQGSKPCHKSRGYDSDTGYRSDQEHLRYKYLQSLTISPQHSNKTDRSSDILTPLSPYKHWPKPSRRDGYGSDVESYRGMSQTSVGYSPLKDQHSSQSVPFGLHSKPSSGESHYQAVGERPLLGDEFYNYKKEPSRIGLKHRNYSPLTVSASFNEKMLDQSTPNFSNPPHSFSQLLDQQQIEDAKLKSSKQSLSKQEEVRWKSSKQSLSQQEENKWKTSKHSLSQQEEIYAVLENKTLSIAHKQESSVRSNSNVSEKTRPSAPPSYHQHSPLYSSTAALHWQQQQLQQQQQQQQQHYQYHHHPHQKQPSQTPLQKLQNEPSPLTSPSHSSNNFSSENPYGYISHSSPSNKSMQHSSPIYDYTNYTPGSPSYRSGSNSPSAYGQKQFYRPGKANSCRTPDMAKGNNSDCFPSGLDSPRGSTSSRSDGGGSVSAGSGSRNLRYEPHRLSPLYTNPASHLQPSISHYEDVAIFKSVEPSTSSTDSGYGHVYEKVETHIQRQVLVSQTNNKSASQRNSYQVNPNEDDGLSCTPSISEISSPTPSREVTPSRCVETVYRQHQQQQQHRQQQQQKSEEFLDSKRQNLIQVSINKNPGLGFSIAGGIGSYGNPFKPDDIGIFITKVQPEGPALNTLFPGDKILKVNGVDFSNIEHTRAVDILRNSNPVMLLVERS
ncbi:leucine-rich repeat-containing protein 7-like [Octopus sinensis]|uniref:Leucine-rich repeat-containing protein 7-like n=1 Tax=Octopus sinensis TaxID=2607531 RepID=A0A6P7SR27_9MOLL|nr:leucine-rich repeat-containing protein 7-like [Octopus sinensis]